MGKASCTSTGQSGEFYVLGPEVSTKLAGKRPVTPGNRSTCQRVSPIGDSPANQRRRTSARNFSRVLPIIPSDMKIRPLRLSLTAGLAATLVCLAVPAHAQYQPKPLKDAAIGESFHIEASGDIWMPSASISVRSEGLGIEGNQIDMKRDLGVVDKHMSALGVVLRPAPRGRSSRGRR